MEPAARRRSGSTGTPAQEIRLAFASSRASQAERRVRELDPEWRPTPNIEATIEGQIRGFEARAAAAEARLAEILRDAIPGTNPSWGVNRLRKELNEQGYYFEKLTDAPGFLYKNPTTGDWVRIMESPPRRYGTDPPEKHFFDYYYRYKPANRRWGAHVPIPNK